MKYIINSKGMDVTDDLKEYVEKRFEKLGKYFSDDTEVHVTLTKQKNDEKVEVTIPMKGTTIRAEETSQDIRTTIDMLDEIVERQLRRNRKKLIDRYQNAQSLSSFFEDGETDDEDEEASIRIVRSKRFAIKPMDPEEACFQMDMLGHNFYVFYNSETDLVSVVYKRKDGDYGLIEPEY